MLDNIKKASKRDIWLFIKHNFLIIIGTIMLGFGTAIFLTENVIVAGGLSGIAFIVQHFLPESQMMIDIVVWILTALLWILSLFFLGKQFAFRTLIASVIFPASLSLFYRVDIFMELARELAGNGDTGDLLLCAIFGGIINGAGLSLTFLGKGSTGGVDVLAFVMNKYAGMKVSTASLLLDVTVISVGIFALDFPHMIDNCLVGIIAASVTSLMVEYIYSKRDNAFILDIVSSKWEEITAYIINDMERGVSLLDIEGAYTSTKRKMIRTVLSKNEYVQIKDYIAKIDPYAFLTFTDTNAVFGEGFKENLNPKHKKILNKIKGKDKTDKK